MQRKNTERPTPGAWLEAEEKSAARERERAAKSAVVLAQLRQVAEQLPGFIRDRIIKGGQFTAYADVTLDLWAEDRADALGVLIELAELEPVARVRDGCVAHKPAAKVKEGERERGTVHDELWPLFWELEPGGMGIGGHWPGGAKLEAWRELGGWLVELRVWIASDPAHFDVKYGGVQYGGDRPVIGWELRKEPNGDRVGFAGGARDKSPGNQVLAFWVEPGHGPSPLHYLGGGISPDWSDAQLRRIACAGGLDPDGAEKLDRDALYESADESARLLLPKSLRWTAEVGG